MAFHAKTTMEALGKLWQLANRWRQLRRICKGVVAEDPQRTYTDLALTPVLQDGVEDLKLYSQTASAERAVVRERRAAGLSTPLQESV
jgi:hypothetical protein